MLPIGRFRAGSCSGVTRRAFLEMAAAAPLGLSLAGNAAGESAVKTQARSVIFIWLWGAPSHLDTFDPKPDAPSEYRGPFSPIATRTAGLQFTELLPQLASRSDKFSIIRSNVSFAPGHPDAGTFGLTGFAENPEPPQPNFGSIIAKHRGQRGTMPPFIALGRGIPKDVVRIVKGYGGGTLGKTYDPFQISCSDQGEAEIPSLSLLSELTPGRLSDRRTLLTSLDKARRELDAAAATDLEGALLLHGGALDVVVMFEDLEPDETEADYRCPETEKKRHVGETDPPYGSGQRLPWRLFHLCPAGFKFAALRRFAYCVICTGTWAWARTGVLTSLPSGRTTWPG